MTGSARPSLIALLATLLTSACASPRDAGPRQLQGCFYFVQDETARSLRLPWGVRLLQDSLEGWPAMANHQGVHSAATLHPDGDRDHPFGYWRPLAGDSLEIGYPAGGGMVMRLRVGDDELAGTVRPVGDAVSLQEDGRRAPAPVTLTRALCPEES